MMFPELFEPFQLKSMSLRNRIVMAPMTRSRSPQGIPTSAAAAYYARRAAAGVGLIVTEGTVVDRPGAHADPNVPRFHGAALLAWKHIVDSVHAAGGIIAPQLWHAGSTPDPNFGVPPAASIDSPSGLSLDGILRAEPLTDEGIADVIAAFGRAAAEAKRLEFDAVELHGAHGYLIDQFFFSATNRRSDRWGGASLAKRLEFAVELVRAVRRGLGRSVPLILRLSQWKIFHFGARLAGSPEELRAWLEPLAEAGVDMFHCSQRRFWEAEFAGSDLNFAGWAKKLTGRPTITVGSVGLSGEFIAARTGEKSKPASLDEVARRLARGDFDLVAVGRALLADPEWLQKIKEGRTDELKDYDNSAREILY
jgi:2,4-dienoyl-CoA reductase-like NADH-dependent reductase (Old Yellow Enzyme family)